MPLLRCLNLKNMNTFLTPNVNFNVNTISTTFLCAYSAWWRKNMIKIPVFLLILTKLVLSSWEEVNLTSLVYKDVSPAIQEASSVLKQVTESPSGIVLSGMVLRVTDPLLMLWVVTWAKVNYESLPIQGPRCESSMKHTPLSCELLK